MGAGLGVALGTLTAACSRRERGRRCGAGPSGRVADGQRRDGRAQGMIRRKHPVVAMAMPAWRRDEVGESIEKLPRREIDDAVVPRASGLELQQLVNRPA